MELEILTTRPDVIDALGGNNAVAKLTGRENPSAVANWRKYTPTFPSNTHLCMTAALAKIGKTAPASLWGMVEAAE